MNFTPDHIKYLKQLKRKQISIHIAQVGILVLFLVIWEAMATVGIIDSFFTSSPSKIWAQLVSLSSNDLGRHIWASTYETILGFAIGTVLGYIIAIALWWNDNIKSIFEPYLVVINSLPKIALGPLIIIWCGTGRASIVVMAVLISVVITTITILNGFVETDSNKILLMRSMHANRYQILTKLVIPANIPTLMSTLKINVGMSWVGTIMGEYLVSKEGLGYLLVYGSQTFKLDLVMTCTIILCALAGLMYAVVALAEKLVIAKNNF